MAANHEEYDRYRHNEENSHRTTGEQISIPSAGTEAEMRASVNREVKSEKREGAVAYIKGKPGTVSAEPAQTPERKVQEPSNATV